MYSSRQDVILRFGPIKFEGSCSFMLSPCLVKAVEAEKLLLKLVVIGSPSRDVIEPYTACPTTVKTAGAPDINILHPLHRLQAYFEPISVALPHSIVTYHACQGEVCQHIGCRLYRFWRVFYRELRAIKASRA
jgi:hypothetical protein